MRINTKELVRLLLLFICINSWWLSKEIAPEFVVIAVIVSGIISIYFIAFLLEKVGSHENTIYIEPKELLRTLFLVIANNAWWAGATFSFSPVKELCFTIATMFTVILICWFISAICYEIE